LEIVSKTLVNNYISYKDKATVAFFLSKIPYSLKQIQAFGNNFLVITFNASTSNTETLKMVLLDALGCIYSVLKSSRQIIENLFQVDKN